SRLDRCPAQCCLAAGSWSRCSRVMIPDEIGGHAMAHVKITPLHPSLGASIEGIDLAEPVDEPTRQTLSRALADHLALVFPAQSLTPAQYLAAPSLFGPPMEQPYSHHHLPEAPMIGR